MRAERHQAEGTASRTGSSRRFIVRNAAAMRGAASAGALAAVSIDSARVVLPPSLTTTTRQWASGGKRMNAWDFIFGMTADAVTASARLRNAVLIGYCSPGSGGSFGLSSVSTFPL